MVFLVNKKLICIAFLALSSVDVTFAQDSAAPIEEEAPTAMPILSGVSTPTEAPTEMAILNGDVDENGCIPSAGYSWCPSLEECIRSFETDCPSAAPTDSPILPGSDRDENGCIPSAGYSWCDPLKECIKSWETDCPGTTTPSPTKSASKDPTSSPTTSPTEGPTAPTSDEGVSCVDPSTYNPTFTPQCINVGSGGYTCKNVRLGGTPDYRCVAPAPTSSPTDAPVNRPAPGSDRDENGCKSSAGYSWCASLDECIRNFETDCPDTTPSPTAKPTPKPTISGLPAPSAKPTLGGVPAPPVVAECSAYESCRESELEGNCCPTDEGDMLGCCSGIDPETPVVAPTLPPAPPTTTEFPFTALPTAGGSSSVSSITTVSTIAAAVAVAVAALL